jgi:leucyl aminopeptidase
VSRQTESVTAANLLTTAPTTFDPVPSRAQPDVSIGVSGRVPAGAGVVGVPVAASGPVPRQLGVDRATLVASGFDGKVGETLVVPRRGGASVVAVGIGDPATLDAAGLRDAAAAFARAAGKHTEIATTLTDVENVAPEVAGQVVAEGILLARYRYHTLKRDAGAAPLSGITLVAGSGRAPAVGRGAERGKVIAGAAQLARDLANTPPGHLTASRMADVAVQVAGGSGLAAEVYGAEDIAALGCGGLLGVNAGSSEPPRLVKLSYTPRGTSGRARKPSAHLALVGKGVMYDSGGISLKPTDPMHAAMKMDMSGAAAVLASMSALAALDCRNAVTGYLLCTDNMPSGSAMKLGDVLTIHGGTTVEVHNTDAEGRLLLADGLAMALEERPDAVVDIATLTGACMIALGPSVAGVLGNDQTLIDQVTAASATTDEATWQLPLERRRYRKLLDSDIADIKNVGGPYGGAITAAVFLSEFVGDLPWAHLDIAGPMKVDADESWRSKGATGFGTRLLIELATSFTRAD